MIRNGFGNILSPTLVSLYMLNENLSSTCPATIDRNNIKLNMEAAFVTYLIVCVKNRMDHNYY